MSFAFPDIDPNTSGSVTSVDIPLNRYLTESFSMGEHDSILSALNRIGEIGIADMDETSPILDPKTAMERWGVGNLKFDQPVRESVARIMNQRKRDEMDREYFLTHGATPLRFAPGLAAGMIGSMSNPLDLGAIFLPFVGSEAAVAKAGSVAGRLAARRLITREALAQTFPRAPKLTESVINATVGQALFEVPTLIAATQDQANYGIDNSLLNIAAGGALGAAIHGAGVLLDRLGRGVRLEMARQAFNQALRDDAVNVHRYVQVDEIALWEKVRFDEAGAVGRAYEAINIDDIAKLVRDKYGEKVSSPAVRLADGQIVAAESHLSAMNLLTEGQRALTAEEGFVTASGKFISREEAGKLMGLPDIGYNHVMWENDRILAVNPKFADPKMLGEAELARFNQLKGLDPKMTDEAAFKVLLKERAERRERLLMSQPGIQKKMEEERVAAINRLVEEERAIHEQKKQGLFDALKQREIDKQIAEGKILADEEIMENSHPQKFEEADEAAIDEDIASLKKELDKDDGDLGPQKNGDQPTNWSDRLDYRDVTGEAVEPSASQTRYAAELAKQDKAAVMKLQRQLQTAFMKAMNRLGLTPSVYGKSESWALWDIGKQLYMREHPQASSSKYHLGDPFTDKRVQKEIVERHIGWELESAQGLTKFSSSHKLAEKGRAALAKTEARIDVVDSSIDCLIKNVV